MAKRTDNDDDIIGTGNGRRVSRADNRPERISADVDAGHLRAFIERVERLEEEKKAVSDDIKEVYAEAKGTGYDTKVMRKIVRLRKMDRQKRIEEEEITNLYLDALGID